MKNYCSLTGIPITQATILHPARVSLVHPELEYALSLSDREALAYAKAVECGGLDATSEAHHLSVECAIRLLTYRFLHKNNRCADVFRPVFLKRLVDRHDLLLACKSLIQLMGIPNILVRDMPYVQHFDTNTATRLFLLFDNGVDRKVDAELSNLLVFIADKDRIQASLDSRVRTLVRVMCDTGTPTDMAVAVGKAWVCDQVSHRCSASSAEYSDDNVTLMRAEVARILHSDINGVNVFDYAAQWVGIAAANAECANSPALSMVKYLVRQWESIHKQVTAYVEDVPTIFSQKLPTQSKLKSKLKGGTLCSKQD